MAELLQDYPADPNTKQPEQTVHRSEAIDREENSDAESSIQTYKLTFDWLREWVKDKHAPKNWRGQEWNNQKSAYKLQGKGRHICNNFFLDKSSF